LGHAPIIAAPSAGGNADARTCLLGLSRGFLTPWPLSHLRRAGIHETVPGSGPRLARAGRAAHPGKRRRAGLSTGPSSVVLTDPDAKQFASGVSKVITYLAARNSSGPAAPSPAEPAGRPGLRQHQKTLTAEEIEQIIARYQWGATMMELARQYGCHRTTVTKKLVDTGVEIREKTPTEKQMEEMERLYTSGLSLVRVGEQVGFSPLHCAEVSPRTRDRDPTWARRKSNCRRLAMRASAVDLRVWSASTCPSRAAGSGSA